MTTMLGRVRAEETHDLSDLAARLLAQQETKRDYVVDTRRMSFGSDQDGSTLTWDVPAGAALMDDGETPGSASATVSDLAHRQIAQRLGIPIRYYDRMRTDAPVLLDGNVRHWFYEKPERRMLRTMDGRVRAFLSDRYRRLDNLDLMEQSVIPTFERFAGELTFHAAALTAERLHVRALLPRLEREVRVGDAVQAGVEIRNSEVGLGALTVTPFVWRLICLNGMVASDRSLSRYHVGRVQEETAYAIYQDDTMAADDAAFFLKVRDAIGAALDEVTFDQIVAEMRAAATGTPVENPVATTEMLAQRYTLVEDEQASVLRYLASGGDLSRWGVANALTATAKHAVTFDRQRDLEAAGGDLVAMPEQEWAAVAVR